MNLEFIRVLVVILAVISIIQFLLFWKRTHEPGIFAPISWLLLLILYSVFKFIVDGDLKYYNIAVIWNNFIFIYGIILLIVGGYLFRDIKTWTYKR
jgi:uncharacterized protein involved in response to NO